MRIMNLTRSRTHGFRHAPCVAVTIVATQTSLALGADPMFGVPYFHIKGGQPQCAGKAFAIQWFENRKILLMPLHLVGPGAQYPVYILPKNVPDVVESVDVLNFRGDQVLTTAKPGLLKTGVPIEKSRGDLGEDLMAFELPSNCSLTLFPLCRTLAPVGTKVWILSKGVDRTSNAPDRYPATVVRSLPSGITMKMDSPLIALSSSGAPIINASGELIGMMLGKIDPSTRMYITAIGSPQIYQKLYRELKH